MNNIKIVFQYDGTRYFGFQKQKNKITIQGKIEHILNTVCKNQINLISSGRTDKGVHASYQVSNFMTDLDLDTDKWKYILNRALPNDIMVLDVEKVPLDFHSRFSAKYREYEYFLTWDKSPFKARYNTYVPYDIDCTKLEKILAPLVGKHNFINFCLTDKVDKSTIREIYFIKVISIDNKTIKINIRANAFLKSQIRIMVGTALDIYFGKLEESAIIEMLNNIDINYKKVVADPEGLFLSNIIY